MDIKENLKWEQVEKISQNVVRHEYQVQKNYLPIRNTAK